MPKILTEPDIGLSPFSLLDKDGLLDESYDDKLDLSFLESLLEAMLRARRFDEYLLNLQRRGEVGTFAPVLGQEAAQIGSICCIEEEDWFVPSFRETAAALWRGVAMEDLFIFTAGWNDGVNLPEGSHNLPNAVPVASQLPHAVGLAYAARLKGEDSVALTYFGDGATSEGDFHEALNFAGILSAPVIFFCQNNGWAISVPRSRQTASKTLAQKAHAYALPCVQVDGNDVLAVFEATREAVRRAREDGEPSMIEAVTYRMEVHTTADDPARYREDEDVEKWRERDPINRVQALLRARDRLDDEAIGRLEENVSGEIDAAWKAAKERIEELENKSVEVIFEHVLATPSAELKRQRDLFARMAGNGSE